MATCDETSEELEARKNAMDEAIMEVFSSLKELSELRKRYESLVSEGYFNLTRTRHNMGRNAVSQFQYPVHMDSSVHVSVTRECKSWSELDTCSDKLQFLTATSSSTSEAEEGQLRQRAGKQQTQSSVQEVKPQPKVTAGNPIRWFSCLPPQSLRQSQSQFIEAVDVAIAMATVQTRVEQMRRRYHFLKYGNEVEEGEKDVDKVEADESDEEEGTTL